jgi:hypothetical protein
MTTTTKRAISAQQTRARKHEAELLQLLEHKIAAAVLTHTVDALRAYEFSDAFIISAFLAGAASMIGNQPDREPWACHLEQLANDARAN